MDKLLLDKTAYAVQILKILDPFENLLKAVSTSKGSTTEDLFDLLMVTVDEAERLSELAETFLSLDDIMEELDARGIELAVESGEIVMFVTYDMTTKELVEDSGIPWMQMHIAQIRAFYILLKGALGEDEALNVMANGWKRGVFKFMNAMCENGLPAELFLRLTPADKVLAKSVKIEIEERKTTITPNSNFEADFLNRILGVTRDELAQTVGPECDPRIAQMRLSDANVERTAQREMDRLNENMAGGNTELIERCTKIIEDKQIIPMMRQILKLDLPDGSNE